MLVPPGLVDAMSVPSVLAVDASRAAVCHPLPPSNIVSAQLYFIILGTTNICEDRILTMLLDSVR